MFRLSICQSIIAVFIFTLTITGTENGRLKGKVSNATGSPIPNIRIVIESDKHLYQFKTDTTGSYEIFIPEGAYKIFTDQWVGKLSYDKEERFFSGNCSSYFRNLVRAKVDIKEATTTVINLILTESGCVNWQSDGDFAFGSFTFVTHADIPKVNYETLFYLKSKEDSRKLLDIVIQYGFREEKGDLTVYTLPVHRTTKTLFSAPFPGVILTFDAKTIYANNIIVDRKKRTILATGNLVLDDNGEQSYSKEIKITVKKDDIQLKITKNANQ